MRTSQRTDQKGHRPKNGPVPFTRNMKERLGAVVIIVFLALFALLWVVYDIQKNNNEEYNKIVMSQRQAEYDSRTIRYRRGDIYDRNGTKVAGSEKVYNLILDPRQMIEAEGKENEGQATTREVIEPTIDALSQCFGYDKDALRKEISAREKSSYYVYEKNISYDKRQSFLELQQSLNEQYAGSPDAAERKKQIKGVWFEDNYKRSYPYNELGCNIIGFSSADGSVGTGGVEQFYNDELIGTNGREYGYLNDEANLERVVKSAENGNSLVLTMDLNIQSIVEKYLNQWQNEDIGSKSAACIVMNPKNGEVLAMASTNSFDLNNPRTTEGYTDEEIYQFGLKEATGVYRRENPDALSITEEQVPEHFTRDEIMSYGTQVAWNKLWRNIPVSDTFEPGSTQKIFTVAGAMEEGLIDRYDTFNCEGNVQLSDGVNHWRINCVNRSGHGPLDVTGGITNSCNVVMMNIAFLEQSETFMKYQRMFGFGDYTGIDLPAEANTEALGFAEDSIGKTALATYSFGQGYNCSMIQMAAAYCSVINGGYYYEPHVVKQILTENGAVIKDVQPLLVRETVSEATCDYLIEALFQTVETGTGGAAGIEGYHIGGKTGTAEKLPRADENYLVSFCGFAPVEDPQLLCYVIVDTPNLEGEAQAHSSFASNIFKNIMTEALPVINLYPEGVEAADYQSPIVLPESEGDAMLPMGSAEAVETETTEVPTDENGETLMAQPETDEAGNRIMPETLPAATDEFIQGDDGGGELPGDELTKLLMEQGLYEEEAEMTSGEATTAGETVEETEP